MEGIVDTRVLVSALIENSKNHRKALEVIERLDTIFVPTVILDEFIMILAKLGVNKRIIAERVKEILEKCIIIPVNEDDYKFAMELIKRPELDIKDVNDLLVISVSRRIGVKIFTFDKRMGEIVEIIQKIGI